MTLVTLDHISKRYGAAAPVLSDISLGLAPGEFVVLVGASGCGKSTLLRHVAGLTAPSEGKFSWKDKLLPGDLGMVFQDATLMPWRTVLGNVRLPLDLQGVARTSADAVCMRALTDVGLAEKSEVYPHLLSGGMKMRVALARAMVTAPRLLLLDEPFGALDEITRERLNEDLSALCHRGGITALFVTHSVYEAVFLGTRIIVMAAGPGRIHADIAVDLPGPRTHDVRLSDAYMAHCRRVSALLAEAMAS